MINVNMIKMSVRWLTFLAVISAVAADTLFFQPHDPPSNVNKVTSHGEKSPASAGIVVCPGGRQECPSSSTCCVLASGKYGCCPLKQAVCCADHLHCCPFGTTCDTAEGKCNRGSVSVPWVTKTAASSAARDVVCPGGQSSCQSGSTCCKMQSGQYGCCPLPQAVCCADHLHCCPYGTTCDTAEGKCNRGSVSVPWVTKIPASSAARDVVCPGGQSSCPSGSTCCKMQSGQYGCCPLPQAVCCADHLHCCPFSMTCDTAEGKCKRGSVSVPWVTKIPASPKSHVQGVICPDRRSSCPSGSTCCKMQLGEYGCCPIPEAVCCADHLHCCPHGTTCDTAEGKCNRGSVSVPWVTKIPASSAASNVVCPGGKYTCPSQSTCCVMQSGDYGCCPLPAAVCCADHLHCCPFGTTCDTAEGKCNRGSVSVPWVTKTAAVRSAGKLNDVVCGDNNTACPNGNTCCKLQSGGYGCCPLPEAVWCADQIHYCPTGTRCDPSGICTGGATSVYLMKKIVANENAEKLHILNLQSVVCPDKQSSCPVGSTCCKTSSGAYGCCPLPDAVCCADHIHCCPEGSTCNTALGECTLGFVTTPWLEKTAALSVMNRENDVTCPDKVTICPSGSTCCMLQTYQYACCPLPKAVCCSDGIHCCPESTTCDMVHSTCKNRNGESVEWTKKQPALPAYAAVLRVVICPDGKSQCPSGKSCCQLASGDYGCCPYPKGSVCCKDHLHCCPKGFHCNLSKDVCEMGIFTIPFEKAQITTSVSLNADMTSDLSAANNVKCPDRQYMCPDGNTCCRMESGHWGCCPLPKAVCCSDMIHCCPHGMKCDLLKSQCDYGIWSVPWFKKNPAQLNDKRAVVGLPKAVCCKDNVHCCPEGSRCDLSQQACVSTDGKATSWEEVGDVQKQALERKPVPCPGGKHSCPLDTTCCRMKSGLWACCPLADAVCCKDGIHCCPKSYTCDLKTASCTHQGFRLPWLLKQPAIKEELKGAELPRYTPLIRKIPARTRITTDMLQKKQTADDVICPDKTSLCPTGSTCCLLPNKKWGCCPIPQAVCCSDHIHCCPHDSTCDLQKGRCIMSGGQLILSYSRLAPSVSQRPLVSDAALAGSTLSMIICPDHRHECQDQSTCCPMSGGGWGCCPFTDAVCCPDRQYCCPNGYICHMAMCIRGNHKVPATKRILAVFKRPLQ